MEFVQNFPFISIVLSLFSGPFSSILSGKKARILNHFSQQEKYSELVNLIKEKFSTQEDYINSQLAE